MIERIDEISGQPVIGKMYLVPCVHVKSGYVSFLKSDWTPVIGPKHDDAEIVSFVPEHFHIDWRFIRPSDIGDEKEVLRSHGKVIDVKYVDRKIENRRRKCKQEMPEFPVKYNGIDIVSWLPELERAFRDVKLKPDCRVCPHRGGPLTGLPVKNGMVVCSLHGLRWRLSDGAMVPRVLKD